MPIPAAEKTKREIVDHQKRYLFFQRELLRREKRPIILGPDLPDTCKALGLDEFKSSELDWLLIQSKKSLIFYDKHQSIKPSDVLRERYISLENQPTTRIETLKTQFRCKGGNEYVRLIHELFDDTKVVSSKFHSLEYECYLFDDIQLMVDEIKKYEQLDGLSRMVAGYAWEWLSNKDKNAFDIVIDQTK
ncbi:MAG: DNA/RNA helicase domain-containing protein, partial [Undibacterium sp.]